MKEEDLEKLKTMAVLQHLNSKEELRDWFYLYFDLWFPDGHVYPTSNSSPMEAAWEIYRMYKTGESKNCPTIAILASRDSYKSLLAAAMEVVCFVHFQFDILHGASIKEQAATVFKYCEGFFRKLEKYLLLNGWKKTVHSKTKLEYLTDTGKDIRMTIVPCNKNSMNGFHLPMLVIDEAELCNSEGLSEAAMVPSAYKQYFPMTIYLSTRKYAAGQMELILSKTEKVGKIFRWNIVDISEKLPEDSLKRDSPLVRRYLSIKLPLVNISQEEYDLIPEDRRSNLEPFDAYAGIADHQLLPVMRHYTADRPAADTGQLYKSPIVVLNNFKTTNPDMAEAQLLCNKPSGTNLVFSRFSEVENVLSLEDAFDRIGKPHENNKSQEMLKWILKDLGVMMIGGADFGWTDATAMVMLAVFPNGEVWLVDSYVQTNMEIPDIVMKCKEMDVQWDTSRWYCDTAYPAYLKELRKAGLRVPDFKKVVADGLSAIQMKIIDGNSVRKFQVLNIPQNRPVIDAFAFYKWDTDGAGEIIDGQPFHGKDGTSDIMDSIRYPFQNLFAKGGMSPVIETTALTAKTREKSAQEINSELIYGPYKQYFKGSISEEIQKKKRKIMF